MTDFRPLKTNYDFLIIGQGLAGSLLAWHLIQAKKKVLVIDDDHHSASSKVAAGMINPLAGMRFNCHPDTALWLKTALALYHSLERKFQKTYWHPIPMQRLFRSEKQKRFYQRQIEQKTCQRYLGGELDTSDVSTQIQSPFGGFWQYQTGYVELATLLHDLQNWLKNSNALLVDTTNYDHIKLAPNHVNYQEISAKHLIFCEGYRMQSNPWFNALPLQPDKGEIFTLSSQQIISQSIINGAHWLIPLQNGLYRFGATHEHKLINDQITNSGKQALQQGLDQLMHTSHSVSIKHHLAGVRPATQDRQPLIGTHVKHQQIHLFNGFGARGSLTIPWFAEHFIDHLLRGKNLNADISIQRFQ